MPTSWVPLCRHESLSFSPENIVCWTIQRILWWILDILWSDVKYIIFTFLCGDFQTSMLGRFRNIFLQSFYNGVLQKKESIWVIKSLTNTVERGNPNVQISALLDIVQLLNRSDFEQRLKTGHFRPNFRRSVLFLALGYTILYLKIFFYDPLYSKLV